MGVNPDVQDLVATEVKSMLLQLQRRIDMQISQTEWRDPATVAQRQGTPMPPELIKVWTECLHFMQHPKLPVSSKRALYSWIRAKVYPRLGMYIKNMVPIDDMLKPYLDEYDLEVADVHLTPEQRAEVIEVQNEAKKKKPKPQLADPSLDSYERKSMHQSTERHVPSDVEESLFTELDEDEVVTDMDFNGE